MQSHDYRIEAAMYWSAVSLIVCENLPIDQAARRLGVDDEWLQEVLFKRKGDRYGHWIRARSIHADSAVEETMPARRPLTAAAPRRTLSRVADAAVPGPAA